MWRLYYFTCYLSASHFMVHKTFTEHFHLSQCSYNPVSDLNGVFGCTSDLIVSPRVSCWLWLCASWGLSCYEGLPQCPVYLVNLPVCGLCNNMVLRERVISPQPNLQPGGLGDHASSGLYPSTCLAWVALPGVQDSSRRSSRGHGDMQTTSQREGGDPTEAVEYVFWRCL